MQKAWLIFSLFLLSACAGQIKHKMDSVLLHSPEVVGHGKVELGLGLAGVPTVQVTNDVASNPPTALTQKLIRDHKFIGRAGIGYTKKIKGEGFVEVDRIGIKLQALGDITSEAKSGNFSASFLGIFTSRGDYGRGYGTEYKDKKFHTSTDAKYNIVSNGWIAAGILGYRFSDLFLTYAGVSYQQHRYSGGYEIISNARKGRYAGSSKMKAGHLGVEFGFNKKFILRIEDAYSIANIPANGAKKSMHSLGVYFAGVLSAFE